MSALAAVGEDLATFIERATAVDATVTVVDTLDEVRRELGRHCSAGAGFVAGGAAAEVAPPGAGADHSAARLTAVGAGIAVAAAGVVETGSVLMLPESRSERLMLVLPPLQLIVLPLQRLRPSLDDVASLLGADDRRPAPYATLITGPSRTADIERVITVGAHGPRRLHIVIVRKWMDA